MQELDNYDAFVMGRVTYGWFRDNWSAGGGNPYLDRIAAMPKYIASRSLDEVTRNGTLLDLESLLLANLEQLGFVDLGPFLATEGRACVDPEAGAGAC